MKVESGKSQYPISYYVGSIWVQWAVQCHKLEVTIVKLWMLLVSILFVVPFCAQSAPTPEIFGRVIDMDGKPMGGITVYVVVQTQKPLEMSIVASIPTDTEGRFAFEKVPAEIKGEYYLVAYKASKLLGMQRAYVWPACIPQDGFVVEASKVVTLMGRVVDQQGNGMPDVSVACSMVESKKGPLMIMGSVIDVVTKSQPVITDSDGRYCIPIVPEAFTPYVGVSKRGYVSSGSWANNQNIVMNPGGSIAGRVVDKTGKPVAGVVVEIDPTPPCCGAWSSYEAETRSDGSYIIDGLPADSYDIVLGEHKTLVSKYVDNVSVNPGEVTQAPDLVAIKGARVSGRVVDKDSGEAVRGARVRVRAENLRYFTTVVDSAGAFDVLVVPGNVVVYCMTTSKNYPFDPSMKMTVTVPTEGLTRVDFKLKKAEVDVARGRSLMRTASLRKTPASDLWGNR